MFKMRMLTKRLLLLGALLAFLVVPLAVRGQQAGQGLEISPPSVEQSVDPGQSINVSIKLRNVTTSDLLITNQVDDFVAAGEDGTPKLLLESDEQTSYGLKTWVSTIPETTLAPQEQKNIEVTINVPANASPGGHYGVIRFSGTAPSVDGTGVSLSASIGSLVLLRVSGDIVEQASIEDFFVSKDGAESSLFEAGPLNFTERIRNGGNVHIKPEGHVAVKNLFGQEIAKLEVNDSGGNVLPDSVRKFEQTLDKSRMFGRYTANLHLSYGDKMLEDSITFWVIPYKSIAIVLAALIVIFTIIRLSLHLYKRRVVKQNTDQHK